MADSFNKKKPAYYCPPGYQQPFPDYYNYQCNYPRDVFHPCHCDPCLPPPSPPDESSEEDESSYRIPVLESFPWQESVISKNLQEPPLEITKGDRYLLFNDELSGDWTGHQNQIAWHDGFEWKFDNPLPGWTIYVEDEDAYYHFANGQWIYGITASGNDIYFDKTFKTLIISTTNNKE